MKEMHRQLIDWEAYYAESKWAYARTHETICGPYFLRMQ